MDDQYSSYTALLYIFNLIVGTGALTLPKAFSEAGWILSLVLMIFLAFMSYMTATFVIESISLCSSILQWARVEQMNRVSRDIRSASEVEPDHDEDILDSNEDSLMLPPAYIDHFPSEPQRLFTLDVKVELSEMASIVFNKFGQFLFYTCLCVYLFGDLTIYSAAVAKTLMDASCTYKPLNSTTDMNSLCWKSYDFTLGRMYKIYLGLFLFFFGPYVFFNVQKTKYLQVFTSISRWLTFSVMIGLAIARLASPSKPHGTPPAAVLAGLPALIGSSVYSFMCHHSLPGLITPVSNKSRLFRYLAYDYSIILVFYLTLGLTAIFAFPDIEDLYTLNFAPNSSNTPFQKVVAYVLTLFPVYTLTTSFPILAVTLRDNLRAMFVRFQWRFFHTVLIPILTVLPPIVAAMSTENIETLVGVTGSFAGVIIQYVIPASIVILSRKFTPAVLVNVPNPYASPFKSLFWPLLVITWAAVCFSLVVYNLAVNDRF